MIELLTIPEVAQVLRISRGRCYDLCRRGFIPSVRVGRQLRVSPAELNSFIQSGGRSLDAQPSPARDQ
jgi:putative molybdopterin biosynthesis protein